MAIASRGREPRKAGATDAAAPALTAAISMPRPYGPARSAIWIIGVQRTCEYAASAHGLPTAPWERANSQTSHPPARRTGFAACRRTSQATHAA